MDLRHLPWEPILFGIFKLLKVFGIIPGAIAAVGVRRWYQRRRQKRAMEGWPSTDAAIQYRNVRRQGSRSFWVEITYTYFVGEYRVGHYVRHFRKEEAADSFMRELKDKRVQVHYNSSNPEQSVILDRDIELIALLAPELR
jgi:hypothetical protein